MPGEDGYSLIRKLRAANRTASIPAAALTAFARNEDRQRALEAGFQLHLAKPVDVRSLVAAVAKLGKPVHS
jgi:CheY-like chemotaxis protein